MNNDDEKGVVRYVDKGRPESLVNKKVRYGEITGGESWKDAEGL